MLFMPSAVKRESVSESGLFIPNLGLVHQIPNPFVSKSDWMESQALSSIMQ